MRTESQWGLLWQGDAFMSKGMRMMSTVRASFWKQLSSAHVMPGRNWAFWIASPQNKVRHDRFVYTYCVNTFAVSLHEMSSHANAHLISARLLWFVFLCAPLFFHWVTTPSCHTFCGLKSYFTQCWNPFPLDFNEVTIKQPPTKCAE